MKLPLFTLLVGAGLLAETFTPTTMQYGCRSVEAYQRAEAAKGYGAQQVFLDAGCVYLRNLTFDITRQEGNYLRVCSVENVHECSWTPDTRPR